MGPILQYVVGVPFGLFALFGGIYLAFNAFFNKNEKETNNGIWAGVCFLLLAYFGFWVLKAILFIGLDFGGGPGRYG